MAFGIEI